MSSQKAHHSGMLWVVCLLLSVAGCVPAISSRTQEPGLYRRPGFGWEQQGDVDHRGRFYSWWALTGKLYGNVGLPFEAAPTAKCVGSGWTADVLEIVTGALPPGLRISGLHIVGVPTRAGDWYFQVRIKNVQCAGKYYGDYTQNVNIATTGSAAPRRLP
jgi:hypothetical protein